MFVYVAIELYEFLVYFAYYFHFHALEKEMATHSSVLSQINHI